MNHSRVLATLGLCVLLVLAGCGGPGNPRFWEAHIYLDEVSAEDEEVYLDGVVRLRGDAYNVTLREVRLVAAAANGSTIRTIPLGRLNVTNERRAACAEFNATFSSPPEELRIRIGAVQNPEDGRFVITGYRLEDEDELRYSVFEQKEY